MKRISDPDGTPITILDLAMFRGCKDDGSGVSCCDVEDTGLPFIGGCSECGACVACYNACPSRSGVLKCAGGCIGTDGYDSAEEANMALFPEEYTWTGKKGG